MAQQLTLDVWTRQPARRREPLVVWWAAWMLRRIGVSVFRVGNTKHRVDNTTMTDARLVAYARNRLT